LEVQEGAEGVEIAECVMLDEIFLRPGKGFLAGQKIQSFQKTVCNPQWKQLRKRAYSTVIGKQP